MNFQSKLLYTKNKLIKNVIFIFIKNNNKLIKTNNF